MRTIDQRLQSLAAAVHHGASNPGLIKRANRLADEIEAEHPRLAMRLRTALTTRWESLGTRYERLEQIRKDYLRLQAQTVADATEAEPQPDSPAGPDQGRNTHAT